MKIINIRTNGTLLKILKDATMSVNKKCELSMKLCYDLEAYNMLKIEYTLFHNSFKVATINVDACNSKTFDYDHYGFSKTCPAKKVNLFPIT